MNIIRQYVPFAQSYKINTVTIDSMYVGCFRKIKNFFLSVFHSLLLIVVDLLNFLDGMLSFVSFWPGSGMKFISLLKELTKYPKTLNLYFVHFVQV